MADKPTLTIELVPNVTIFSVPPRHNKFVGWSGVLTKQRPAMLATVAPVPNGGHLTVKTGDNIWVEVPANCTVTAARTLEIGKELAEITRKLNYEFLITEYNDLCDRRIRLLTELMNLYPDPNTLGHRADSKAP